MHMYCYVDQHYLLKYVCLYSWKVAILMFRFRTIQCHETTYFIQQNIWRLHECLLPDSYFWLVLTTVPWIKLLYKSIATESSVISDFSNLTFTCIFSRFIWTYVILAHLFPVFLKCLHLIESGLVDKSKFMSVSKVIYMIKNSCMSYMY